MHQPRNLLHCRPRSPSAPVPARAGSAFRYLRCPAASSVSATPLELSTIPSLPLDHHHTRPLPYAAPPNRRVAAPPSAAAVANASVCCRPSPARDSWSSVRFSSNVRPVPSPQAAPLRHVILESASLERRCRDGQVLVSWRSENHGLCTTRRTIVFFGQTTKNNHCLSPLFFLAPAQRNTEGLQIVY